MTELELANMALHLVGAEKIDALSDNTKRAILMNDLMSPIRKEVLELGKWTFARKRVKLGGRTTAVTAEQVIPTSDEIDWGTSAHGYQTGDEVVFALVAGTVPAGLVDGTTYYVIRVDAYEIKLATTWTLAIAGVTYVDITTAGSGTFTLTPTAPVFQYTYRYALPTDYLSFVREYYGYTFETEGRYMLSDESELNLIYIVDEEDESIFTPNFNKAYYLTLAAYAAYSLNNNTTQKESLLIEADRYISDARCLDSQSTKPEDYEIDTFLDARL